MGVHGVLPEERQRAQPFAVDLDCGSTPDRPPASDDLADTVDYGAAGRAGRRVVAGRSCRLLEALAGRRGRRACSTDDQRVDAVDGDRPQAAPPVGPRPRLGRGAGAARPPRASGRAPTGERRAPAPWPCGPSSAWARTSATGGPSCARAVAALRAGGDVVAVSPLYETEPVGGPAGQDPYLNLVVELSTTDAPARCSSGAGPWRRRPAGSRTVRYGPAHPRRRRPPGGGRGGRRGRPGGPAPPDVGAPVRAGAPGRPGPRPGRARAARARWWRRSPCWVYWSRTYLIDR